MSIAIGNVALRSNLFLAPLAGYTNLPFRLLIRQLGHTGLCTTDLVNARSLIERNRNALKLIETRPADRPLAVQLFGTVPEEMRDASLLLQSLGVDIVDINMGCPVHKVCRQGGGSALMTNHEKTARIVATIVAAVKIPITCKMRLGWDDANLTAPDLARALEDVGAAAITVHGRTRQQGFSGAVNLAGIRAVVAAVRCIPVIGNGDITTPQAAKRMFDDTGCAAISIGRGAFYNPWIFEHTTHYLAAGELLPEPTLDARIAVMTRHLDLMIEVFGEERGCMKFRKVGHMYSKRFGPAKEFDRNIVKLTRRSDFDEIVATYRAWRARFDSHHAGATQHEHEHSQKIIPVPAGPNELW